MPERPTNESFEAIFATILEKGQAWANANHEHPINTVSHENAHIVDELKRFEKNETVALIASLLTLPNHHHQTQCLRLELLVALAILHCKGKDIASVEDAARWYTAMRESSSAIGEDPAEDAFVSLALNNKGGLCGEIKVKLRGITIRNVVMAGGE